MSAVMNLVQTGGGMLPPPLSPESVYERTRPADWLALPAPAILNGSPAGTTPAPLRK